MSAPSVSAIDIERATEQLRQERETFDQQKQHDNRWFILRLAMGYSSIGLLAAILVISSWIIFHAGAFSQTVVNAAGGALFVDTIGLAISVWKGVLKPTGSQKLGPVTKAKLAPGTGRSLGSPPES
jgi:hypothetical protein